MPVALNGGFQPTAHGGNVASTDLDTALHWAGQRGDDADPAVVISFDAPVDAVAEDPWFKGDYRFVKAFVPVNVEIVKDNIVEPVRETALIERAMHVADLNADVRFFETGDSDIRYMYLIDRSKMPDVEDALIGGISVNLEGKKWHVGSVSAHEGYGPMMYRLAMEWVRENSSGRGLSRNLRDETSQAAFNVWDRFGSLSRRDGSNITMLPDSDPEYPEYVAATGELATMRRRWLQLSQSQSNRAWGMLIDLAIGSQPQDDDET